MLLVAPVDQAVRQQLTDELGQVESLFVQELQCPLECVNRLVAHVERYRGKRLRPLLVLVAGMASSPDGSTLTDDHRALATVVEMVHMATLVHDDILDEADVRRGGPTVNTLRGNETAVMLGDYMISHAYHLCSSMDNQQIARTVAHTTNVVCEGELLQLANRENWELDEEVYYQIIDRKTASLCGTCCKLAAVINDQPQKVQDALDNYGRNLGVAFQIIDDLLDLTGDEDTVGKSTGRDLTKGKLTLPLIHFRINAPQEQRDTFINLLSSQAVNNDDSVSNQIRKMVTDFGSVQFASERASELIAQAQQALLVLPDSPARKLLHEMAQAVLTRQF
ncbi:MAG TPA: polyprenyl synthetase family protein [Phycisphaerales bacterium]|nr:polyprenyl synthetase family protein [Phycisphaerales bacterium]